MQIIYLTFSSFRGTSWKPYYHMLVETLLFDTYSSHRHGDENTFFFFFFAK